jgi:hypothetical protein
MTAATLTTSAPTPLADHLAAIDRGELPSAARIAEIVESYRRCTLDQVNAVLAASQTPEGRTIHRTKAAALRALANTLRVAASMADAANAIRIR